MKFDYISILAGGDCPFKCDFCVGNKIRENKNPHFSTKWKAFIECFADMTNLLSISGDTSDPSFIKETWEISKLAKQFNPNIKITLHTRNIKVLEKAFKSGYDKFVFSIDENIDKETIDKLYNYKNKVRLSFVMTSNNFWVIDKWKNELPELFDFEVTIRPEVYETQNKKWFYKFLQYFILIDESIEFYEVENKYPMYVETLKNNALALKKFPYIWFWDYNKTNPNLNVIYLFSNGEIGSNCRWNKITKRKL